VVVGVASSSAAQAGQGQSHRQGASAGGGRGHVRWAFAGRHSGGWTVGRTTGSDLRRRRGRSQRRVGWPCDMGRLEQNEGGVGCRQAASVFFFSAIPLSLVVSPARTSGMQRNG
jgi:hypothetical protein